MEVFLKILFVEDNPDDIELISHELNSNNISFKSRIVQNEQDYRDAIVSFDPDIVISDYYLPAFDGMKALRIKSELNPFLPFILVTGSINEETAVEVMKAGADDYIIKQNLTRLCPAINEAIKKCNLKMERELIEKKFKETNTWLNAFINSNRDIIFLKDINLRYTFINKAAADFFGKKKEDILLRTDAELLSISEAEGCRKSDIEALESKTIVVNEEVVKGRVFETTKFPVFLEDTIIGIGAIIRDITDKKESEKMLKQKIDELEKFTNLTVGRELKMISLKKEVNELLSRLGEKPKYKIVE